jgi:hypothetical protein
MGADGTADLMASLKIRYRIGMAVAPNLYLLGMAREAADDLNGADSALDAAWRASEGLGEQGNRADISYERGIVWARRAEQAENEAEARQCLESALGHLEESRIEYRVLSRPVDEADALMTMAQLRVHLQQAPAARDLFDEAPDIGGELFRNIRAEMIATVRALIGDSSRS